MARVYFTPIGSYDETARISSASAALLETLVKEEGVELRNKVPLKVHFGEKGNSTFIGPGNFDGIIAFIKGRGSEPIYMETNVLYRGERTHRDDHIRLAKEHGFTQIPITIADGEQGEDYTEVPIPGNRFSKCKLGAEYAKYDQLLILSHFKGHMLSGFGGAIKQLAMGCAARGGKLDMHSNARPFTNPLRIGGCKECRLCVEECPADAIEVGLRVRIDRDKCVGCAVCIAVCPQGVFKINWLGAMAKTFGEKLAEYALAAHRGRDNIHITYALNITKGCDCMGKKMKPVVPDIGVFASTDPVAIDQACLDVIEKRLGRKKFGGRYTLEYGESIGLGSREYELTEMR